MFAHGISLVDTNNRKQSRPKGATTRDCPTTKTIGDIMDAFKSITTVEYIRGVKNSGWKPFDGKLWQRKLLRTHHSK
jgi:hypothetical protein